MMKSPRLLVVDDDAGVLSSYRFVLEPTSGHATSNGSSLEAELFGKLAQADAVPSWRLKFADQGLHAVEMVRQAIAARDPFNAVFLDVRMPPGIDGHETAERIRQLDPNVTIVVVTAFSDYTYDDFLSVAGPEDKLIRVKKPVWPDNLRSLARYVTGQAAHAGYMN
jgi:CheY-like chemotaxis protein